LNGQGGEVDTVFEIKTNEVDLLAVDEI